MTELSPVRSALDEIKRLDHVLDASLISRGGMYVMGGPMKGIHRETFAAMSAIILGASETSSTELKDKLRKVTIDLTEQTVMLIGVGPKYLVAIMLDMDADMDMVAQAAKETMTRVESML
jgi:predicted regulator of Ras-like GTPase activity (Roadblock/LC7/MglB family)